MKKIVSLILIVLMLLMNISVSAQSGFTAEITDFASHISIEDENSITLKLKNPTENAITVDVTSKITTLSGEDVCDDTISVEVNKKSSVYQPIALDIENRGEYKLWLGVYQNEELKTSYEKYIYASNRTSSFDNIGICTHFDYNTFYNSEDMTILKNSGFSMIRDECRWQGVEKKKGEYAIPAHVYDYIEEAKKTNTEVMLMLAFNNTLYSDDECNIPVTEENINAFLEYVRYVVKTLKGSVKYFEIWNEPNHENFNRNNATAQQYVNLLKQAYMVIKHENPEAVVISGGTAGSSNAGDYIKKMVAAGVLDYTDVFGIHPYCLNGSIVDERVSVTYSSDIDYLIEECGITKDIWIAEVGYNAESEYYTDREKGAYNIRTMLEFIADGRVKKMFLYQLKHTERGEGYALLDSDATAYESFKMVDTFSERVSNADFVKKWSGYYYSVYQFRDRTTNDDIFIAWTKKDSEIPLEVKAGGSNPAASFSYLPSKVKLDIGSANGQNKIYKYDSMGNKVEIGVGTSHTINYEPTYIVCEKTENKNYCNIELENGFIKGAGYISAPTEYVTVRAEGKNCSKTVYIGQVKVDKEGKFDFSFRVPADDIYEIYVYNGMMNNKKINVGSVDISYSMISGNIFVNKINQIKNGDLIEAEATIENNTNALGDLIFAVAVYTENGKLLSVKTNTLTETGHTTSKIPVNITAENTDEWESVKLFLWKENLTPLTEGFEIK